jgi:hypothetical protein
MKVSDSILNLVNTLNENLVEAAKHESGNNAAGTRLRKVLQEVANCCKDLRAQVQTERNERK